MLLCKIQRVTLSPPRWINPLDDIDPKLTRDICSRVTAIVSNDENPRGRCRFFQRSKPPSQSSGLIMRRDDNHSPGSRLRKRGAKFLLQRPETEKQLNREAQCEERERREQETEQKVHHLVLTNEPLMGRLRDCGVSLGNR